MAWELVVLWEKLEKYKDNYQKEKASLKHENNELKKKVNEYK